MNPHLIFLITISSFAGNLSAQSLATNILFDQANLVYKGRVEKISYSDSNGEGDSFGATTKVEKVYKNPFYGDEIGIRLIKPYMIDTTEEELIMNHSFQIQKDSSYFFFIRKPEEFRGNGKYVYFANLADNQIEGIPFSKELEDIIETFDKSSYLKTHNYSKIPFKILAQSSPIAESITVKKIKKKSGFYLISGDKKTGEKVIIKTKGINCICREGSISINQSYLFFLTPFGKNKFLLTDRWLGVFQLNGFLNDSFLDIYRKKKNAAN